MRSLQNIDAQVVGSICADSSTYCSISDVFKMNNLVSDIRSILSGKKLMSEDYMAIIVKTLKLNSIKRKLA